MLFIKFFYIRKLLNIVKILNKIKIEAYHVDLVFYEFFYFMFQSKVEEMIWKLWVICLCIFSEEASHGKV